MAVTKQEDRVTNIAQEYREAVTVAAYERLLRFLKSDSIGCLRDDIETACKVAHLIKELGLV